MKVLIVSYLLDPRLGGGAATSAMRLCRGLTQQGIEVIALTTHNAPSPRVVTEHGVKTYYMRPRNLYWVAEKDDKPLWKKAIWQLIDTWNPHTYRYAREVIKQERPDVVHVQKLRGLSPSIWAAAKAENCRLLVQTCRDYELVSPEGTLESNVGQLALHKHWALRPYQNLRSRWSNQVDVVTAPSQFTLNTVTNLGFFSRSKQLVIANTHGLSEDELRRMVCDGNSITLQDEISFLFLGRLESTKGADLLCQAFAGIAGELPKARLEIAGKGSMEAELRILYGDMPQIYFRGYVAGQQKEKLLAKSIVMIIPSTSREVFGNSIIEAYTFGKPVIAARIGGIPELVHENETGFLIEPHNVESLQQIIRYIYSNPSKAIEMSRTCYEAARSYSLEAITTEHITTYEEGLKQAAIPHRSRKA
jgi:glycosyltransferase involved in cell wall biosynthesis